MGGGWPPTDQGRKLGVVGVGSWLMGRDGESGGWSPPLPVTQHHWPALLGALCGGSDGLRDGVSSALPAGPGTGSQRWSASGDLHLGNGLGACRARSSHVLSKRCLVGRPKAPGLSRVDAGGGQHCLKGPGACPGSRSTGCRVLVAACRLLACHSGSSPGAMWVSSLGSAAWGR